MYVFLLTKTVTTTICLGTEVDVGIGVFVPVRVRVRAIVHVIVRVGDVTSLVEEVLLTLLDLSGNGSSIVLTKEPTIEGGQLSVDPLIISKGSGRSSDTVTVPDRLSVGRVMLLVGVKVKILDFVGVVCSVNLPKVSIMAIVDIGVQKTTIGLVKVLLNKDFEVANLDHFVGEVLRVNGNEDMRDVGLFLLGRSVDSKMGTGEGIAPVTGDFRGVIDDYSLIGTDCSEPKSGEVIDTTS